jgi:hypothetical protein
MQFRVPRLDELTPHWKESPSGSSTTKLTSLSLAPQEYISREKKVKAERAYAIPKKIMYFKATPGPSITELKTTICDVTHQSLAFTYQGKKGCF